MKGRGKNQRQHAEKVLLVVAMGCGDGLWLTKLDIVCSHHPCKLSCRLHVLWLATRRRAAVDADLGPALLEGNVGRSARGG